MPHARSADARKAGIDLRAVRNRRGESLAAASELFVIYPDSPESSAPNGIRGSPPGEYGFSGWHPFGERSKKLELI